MTRLFPLILAGALLCGSAAQAQPAVAQIVRQFVEGADLGPARGICIGPEAECRAKGEQSARTGIDLLVTFDLDSAELKTEAQGKLVEIAAALADPTLKPHRFAVEGYTDARGTEAHNAGLSARRAQAVRAFLLARGVEASRLTAVGKGASNFRVADPYDPINRRVELRLLPP